MEFYPHELARLGLYDEAVTMCENVPRLGRRDVAQSKAEN
jgi:hypothetical protein